VPQIDLASSELAPGVSPVRVHYRDRGAGPAIVILHGGWGYAMYPFERQIAALAADSRVVIALLMGLSAPDRPSGIIVEATYVFRKKPASREFFETMMRDPDGLGERVTGVLARDPRTEPRELEALRAALEGGARSAPTSGVGAIPDRPAAAARFVVLPEGAHSPHSERAFADEVTEIAQTFLLEGARNPPSLPGPPDLPGSPRHP
jgi:hypothetical protein